MSLEKVIKYRENCLKNDMIRDKGLATPEDIIRFDDIKYGEFEDNLLDVYYPKGTANKLPVIISIHGGGWVYGDKDLYQYYCMNLAQRGFVVINFSYRLAPDNRYPAALEDCFKAFRWLSDNRDKYYFDYDNIFVLGDSAGGQLALQSLVILTNKKFRDLFDMDVVDDLRVRACCLNCGAYYIYNRIIKPSDSFLTKDYLPEDYKPVFEQFQYVKYINKDFPPAFVMTSYYDFLKLMAKPLYNKIRRNNIECEYHLYGSKDRKDIGHVFHLNLKEPEATKCNDEECNFFKRHIV